MGRRGSSSERRRRAGGDRDRCIYSVVLTEAIMCGEERKQLALLAHLDQLEAAGVVFKMAYTDAETGQPLPPDFEPLACHWSQWQSAFCVIPPAGMDEFAARVLADDNYYADLYEAYKVKTLGTGWWVLACGGDE